MDMCIGWPAKLVSFEQLFRTMMNDYRQPLSNSLINQLKSHATGRALLHAVHFLQTDWPEEIEFNLAILGIKEDRFRPEFAGCAEGPDKIREELYQLIQTRRHLNIIDLGNIEAGNSIQDSHFALTQVLGSVLKRKIPVVLLGGSQDLIAAQYAAFQGLVHNMQVVVTDAKAEMQMHEDIERNNYLPKIIAHEPGFLFNITQAGYQGYYVEPETYDAFERMNFDMLRLGSLRGNMTEIEPYLRDAHMLAFSLQAVRGSDAPAQLKPSPNGFSGEEACQLTRYAGLSNDLQCAGFFDYNPSEDKNKATALLLAQMIWYFIDGLSNRKADYPVADNKDYLVYRTAGGENAHEIVFYKSKLSNRWWMEVPYPHERSKHEGKFIIPCSYKDYQAAQNNEIPDKWIKTYQKLI